ncbi:MAG: hypothetical protein ACLPVF_03790 [Acidimicrobiales bacterium]
MTARRLVPMVLLAVLVLLLAGAAVWALTKAPNSADLTVHNGTGETFSAQQFSLVLTTTVSSGTERRSVGRLIAYTAPDQMVVFQVNPTTKRLGTVPADGITEAIDQYTAVTAGSTNWVRQGSHFERTESLRVYSARLSGKTASTGSTVPGIVHEIAVVRGGYLVYVHLNVLVKSQVSANGQTAVGGSEQETLHLVRINGARAPAVTS